MDHVLIHPPLADPTQPYLSLPTLAGWLRARGLGARVLDLNVEAAHWLFERATLEQVGRRIGARFVDLNREGELDFLEQLEYRRLVEARAKVERAIAADPAPPEVFQSRERFFDPARYSLARRQVEDLLEALSAAWFPYRFGFNHHAHAVVPWSFALLARYCDERSSPFDAFYERWFTTAEAWDWESGEGPPCDPSELGFVGISVVFPSQIPEALYLCRFLRERAPRAFLALGGPCLHQIAVHLADDERLRLLEYADGIGLFEGEETLAQLLPRLAAWRAAASAEERFALLAEVPNLLAVDPRTGRPHLGPRWSLDLREAVAPDYSDLDLDRYWAPSRTILYAPTRGCYWGKCSFCYYGLTETATASYREVPPEQAASELGQLARRYGAKNVYLSCDVLSPRYALRLAEALIEKGVKIRWSSDLKIERYFSAERCRTLFRSGLRSAAFGIESGSDRILELMRKGTDRATMTAVNRAFHEAGIATEWMTFTDHPGESVEEALETVRWIDEQEDAIDLFLVGKFGLERGSHIAQEPARYGVRSVFFARGDDLKLYAQLTQRGGARSAASNERVERTIDEVARRWELHPYPWAGANSTHHTFLHFLELGPRAFRTHFQRAPAATRGRPDPAASHIAGLRERPRFSVEAIAARESAFFASYLPRALYTTVPSGRDGDRVAPLSLADFEQAAAAEPQLRAGAR